DNAGNLYGTIACLLGRRFCASSVFKFDPSGKMTEVHNFMGGPGDGFNPLAGLIRDSAGNLYGTTYGGGTAGYGTGIKLDPMGNETVLNTFPGGREEGDYQEAGLIRDGAVNLYGTASTLRSGGGGVVFKLAPTGQETALHSFPATNGDGA